MEHEYLHCALCSASLKVPSPVPSFVNAANVICQSCADNMIQGSTTQCAICGDSLSMPGATPPLLCQDCAGDITSGNKATSEDSCDCPACQIVDAVEEAGIDERWVTGDWAHG